MQYLLIAFADESIDQFSVGVCFSETCQMLKFTAHLLLDFNALVKVLLLGLKRVFFFPEN
jgi:hypothetical protein